MGRRQDSVVNKINYDSGQSIDTLKKAQKNPYDEFYTPLNDIQTELIHYGEKLRGKNIICPCDWDIFKNKNIFSLTVEFSDEAKPCITSPTWTINKIKRVIYKNSILDLIEKKTKIEEVEVTGEEAEKLMKNRVTCNFLKCLISIGEQYGIKSITASGYDSETDRGIKFQNVDYSKYDVCITNPPFSLYSDFMKCMIGEYDKRVGTDSPFDFILLAPYANRGTPNVGLQLMLHKCYLGYGRHLNINFVNPDTQGIAKCKLVGVDWITTFSDAQDEIDKTRLYNNVQYETYKDEFYEMENMTMKDGTHPIRINNISIIPDDYSGWMFSSIGVLDKLSNEEFEWYIPKCQKYFNQTCSTLNPFNHNISEDMFYHNNEKLSNLGVVFKRKEN